MARLLAVTIIVIAIVSAIPVIMHTWEAPADISTHGQMIDDQMADTMIEAGISFLAAQILLALFIWKSPSNKPGPEGKFKVFPGGAKGLIIASIVLVGVEVLALGAFGSKAWARVYFTPPAADAMPIQVQAGQFAFYFRYPGKDGKFGPIHPEMISEATQNLFGLDPEHDVESRDDVVAAELAIPVNKEIHLLMHAKDVSHSFLRACAPHPSGLRARPRSFRAFYRHENREVRNCMFAIVWARTLQHARLPGSNVPRRF
jgi:cytochrome c oxidase subunit II